MYRLSNKRRSSAAAFSLIEVMVALLILAMLTSTLWISFGRALDSQEASRSIDERTHEVRLALERMAREISMAFLEMDPSNPTKPGTAFIGRDSQQKDRLDFIAFAHTAFREEAKEGDAAEISYYTEVVDGQLTLFRRTDPQPDDETDSGGTRFALLEDIEGIQFRYFDSRPNTAGWVNDWDTRNSYYRDLLPLRVEIEVIYKNYRGNPVSAKTSTLIAITEAIR